MLVREIDTQPGDRYLIPGDIHADKQDNEALRIMLAVARRTQVNGVVLVGDTFESMGISRHKGMRRARNFRLGKGTIKAEERAIRPWIEALDALVSTNRKRPGGLHVLTGNHENWWSEIQDEYPGLMDTPWFELYGDLFDGWHVHKEHTALKLGPLLVCHGHRLRGSLSKNSAAAVLANYPGQNTLYGHTHRISGDISPTYKYGLPVDHGAWSVGHMKDIYEERKDPFSGPLSERHRQGFGLISYFEVAGELRFSVEVVPISRDRRGRPFAVVSGRVFT